MSEDTLAWVRAAHVRRAALAGAALLAAIAAFAYLRLDPGAVDQPEGALSTDEAYVSRLESHLRSQPRDGRGWVLLARAYLDSDRFADAAAAYERALAASPKVSRDPAVLCEYADALGMVEGRLDGKPTELITLALSIDPSHPVALEMAGSAAYERGHFADAARHWKLLLAVLEPQSERYQELAAAIERAERRSAVSLPPA